MPPAAPDAAAPPARTAVQQRTRRAILRSAVAVWASDFSASLGEIADHAEVSRSTVHRYFPDREALVHAAGKDAVRRLGESYDAGAAHAQDILGELEASVRAAVEAADAVLFLFSDPNRFGEESEIWGEDSGDGPMLEIVQRGQADGVINPDLAPTWVLHHFYATIYTAAELVTSKTLPAHTAAEHAVTSWLFGVKARDSPPRG